MPRARHPRLTPVRSWYAISGCASVSDSFAKPTTSAPATATKVASARSPGPCMWSASHSSYGSTDVAGDVGRRLGVARVEAGRELEPLRPRDDRHAVREGHGGRLDRGEVEDSRDLAAHLLKTAAVREGDPGRVGLVRSRLEPVGAFAGGPLRDGAVQRRAGAAATRRREDEVAHDRARATGVEHPRSRPAR